MADRYFNLREVVEQLSNEGMFIDGSPDVYRPSTDVQCPICGGQKRTKPKLHLSFDPSPGRTIPEGGSFICYKCGESGGPMALYSLFHGYSSNSEAAREFLRATSGKEVKGGNVKSYTPKPRLDVEIAGVDTLDFTYSVLFEVLSLSDKHKEHLKEVRGLSDKVINENRYRSVPLTGFSEIAKTLVKRGAILEGVPGFHVSEDGEWTFKPFKKTGIMFPILNGKGQIQAVQIRYDEVAEGEPRFVYLSSCGLKKGASPGAPTHLRLGDTGLSDVILTEGPLKADIISCLTGYSVMSIQGVSAQRSLVSALIDMKKAGLKKIGIAFDMDMWENDQVLRAFDKLFETLNKIHIPFYSITWDAGKVVTDQGTKLQFKGLDDYLLAH